jgi:prephenate dehydrogenase
MPKSRVTIVGLGLIGGSIGLSLKSSKAEIEIVGHDKNSSVAGRAVKRGAVDKTNWNLIGACEGAGLIILALPLDAVKETLAALKQYVQPGVIITDTATSKVPVLEWAKELPEGVHFIGGHPVLRPDRIVNGHGIDAADAMLFQGATYCLTPSTNAAASSLDVLTNFAGMLGAKAYFIDAAEHDGLSASVEQFPALLATALAAVTMLNPAWRELGKLASNELRVITEIVPSDGNTAREQFLAHRTNLIRLIDTMTEKLNELRGMCQREDAAALQALVESIGEKRAQWLEDRLDKPDTPSVNLDSIQNSTARLFLGGLANRMPKSK